MRVLVVNAGSSSLKLRVLDPADRVVASTDSPASRGLADRDVVADLPAGRGQQVDRVVASADLPAGRGQVDRDTVAAAVAGFGLVDAVGHRVVHGGTDFVDPVRIDDGVVARLRALTDLAPLHQPQSPAALAGVGDVLPGVPAAAFFGSAFYARLAADAPADDPPAPARSRAETSAKRS